MAPRVSRIRPRVGAARLLWLLRYKNENAFEPAYNCGIPGLWTRIEAGNGEIA